MPGVGERLHLWKGCMPGNLKEETNLDWEAIATEFELTGAAIVNVIQYALLKAFRRKDGILGKQHILDGIRKDFRK